MTSVLLVTFDLLPEGEPGGSLLVDAFARSGVEARWVCWDDADVDWAGADLVAVRSTWDYHRRLPDFLAWARRVEQETRLLNGADVFAWNADKAYLLDLAEHVAVVPTALVAGDALAAGVAAAVERWGDRGEPGEIVVKPRTSAGGLGLVVASGVDDPRLAGIGAGPWVAQPVVESVRTVGESSVFVLDGVAVRQVDKVATADDVRVHEHFGGTSRPVELDAGRAGFAQDVVRVAAQLRGADLAYARVDLMQWDGQWVVSELEVIEPGLYLDVTPDLADVFASLVAGRLTAG